MGSWSTNPNPSTRVFIIWILFLSAVKLNVNTIDLVQVLSCYQCAPILILEVSKFSWSRHLIMDIIYSPINTSCTTSRGHFGRPTGIFQVGRIVLIYLWCKNSNSPFFYPNIISESSVEIRFKTKSCEGYLAMFVAHIRSRCISRIIQYNAKHNISAIILGLHWW